MAAHLVFFHRSLVLTLCLFVFEPLRADDAAIEWSGTETNYGGDGALMFGFRFRVESDVVVTSLGYYDGHGDGLLGSHKVGLWAASGGAPIVTKTVPAGSAAPLEGHFRYVEIPEVSLSKGAEYIVAASNYVDGVEDEIYGTFLGGVISVAPEITWRASRNAFTPNGEFVFPTREFSPPDSNIEETIFGANFKVKRLEPRIFGLCVGQTEEASISVLGGNSALAVHERLSRRGAWAESAEGNSLPIIFNESWEAGVADSVRSRLEEMQVRDGDTFIFYFNGHAGPVTPSGMTDPGGENPVVINAQSDSQDEYLSCGLSDDDLYSIFSEEKWLNVRKIFFIDACHSGGFIGNTMTDLGDLEKLNNTAIFASATEEKDSYTVWNPFSEGFGMGVWTYELLLPALDHSGVSSSGLSEYFNTHLDAVVKAYTGQEGSLLDLNAPGSTGIFSGMEPVSHFSPDFDPSQTVFPGDQPPALMADLARRTALETMIQKFKRKIKQAKKLGQVAKAKRFAQKVKKLEALLRTV